MRPVIKEDGEFVHNELNEFVNKELLPEMKKIFPKSSIKKEIIGEIIGFNKVSKSEACEFISNLTGDNSREVVSFGTEAGLFQKIGISTVVCGHGSIEKAHNVDEFISKQRYYSALSNKKKNILKAVASPCWTFFKLYFIKLGFLDGWYGYIIAKIYAKYTFWKYSK